MRRSCPIVAQVYCSTVVLLPKQVCTILLTKLSYKGDCFKAISWPLIYVIQKSRVKFIKFLFINYFFSFSEKINQEFQTLLLPIALSSLPKICSTIYAISLNYRNIDLEFLCIIINVMICVIEVFMNCWIGSVLFQSVS